MTKAPPPGRRPLTAKQTRFVAEYGKDLNATQAAIRAGYTAKWADKYACKLTGNRGIAAAIARQQATALAKVGLTIERTLEEIRRIAYADVRQLFDGPNLKPLSTLSDDVAASVASFEVVIKNAAAGDGHTDTIHKLKTWDKLKALELAAKHLGLLVEHVDVTVSVDLLARLDAWKAQR